MTIGRIHNRNIISRCRLIWRRRKAAHIDVRSASARLEKRGLIIASPPDGDGLAKLRCANPKCDRPISAANRSGVCKVHNHMTGCRCARCVQRGSPSRSGPPREEPRKLTAYEAVRLPDGGMLTVSHGEGADHARSVARALSGLDSVTCEIGGFEHISAPFARVVGRATR